MGTSPDDGHSGGIGAGGHAPSETILLGTVRVNAAPVETVEVVMLGARVPGRFMVVPALARVRV